MIEDEYLVNWIVDNLPAATGYRRPSSPEFTYMDGFLVGILQHGHYYIHNHVTLDIQYHQNPEKYEGYRIVGFEVEPRSSGAKDFAQACSPTVAALDLDAQDEILYTY